MNASDFTARLAALDTLHRAVCYIADNYYAIDMPPAKAKEHFETRGVLLAAADRVFFETSERMGWSK